MQRLISIVLGLGVIALVVVLGVKGAPTLPHAAADAAAPASSASGAAAGGGADAGSARDEQPDSASLFLPHASEDDFALEREGGAVLPANAPKRVRFGVILVEYDGAEGASAKARSKKDALALAERLAGEAKSDFHAAVQHGDSGSADDVGFVHRGLLEPAPEAALFTLAVGGVSDVVDTPRGYWIAKRLE